MKKAIVVLTICLLFVGAFLLVGCQKKESMQPEPVNNPAVGGESTSGTEPGGGGEPALEPFLFELLWDGTYQVSAGGGDLPKKLEIPTEHEGVAVTQIKAKAFKGNTSIEEVIVPESITLIGAKAFADCTALTTFKVPYNVNSKFLGDVLDGCTALRLFEGWNPSDNSSGSITWSLVYSYTAKPIRVLTRVATTMPSPSHYVANVLVNSVRCQVEFFDYSELSSIQMPTGGADVWVHFTDEITSFTVPDGVLGLGVMGGSNLTTLVLPESVNGCLFSLNTTRECLLSVCYQGTLAKWVGEMTVDGFPQGTSLYIGGNKVEGELVIPASVTAIKTGCFSGLADITSVVLPEGVTEVGSFAFSACTGITSVTIPHSVTEIDYYAFMGCSNLTSIIYQGTEEEWRNVKKELAWDMNTGNYTVIYQPQA